MKKAIYMAFGVTAILIVFCIFFSKVNVDVSNTYRKYQHEEYADADSGIGATEIPADFMVDESFVTHLPLVIIDVDKTQIPNIYKYDKTGQSKIYRDESMTNPWANMEIEIIANENGINRITDLPTVKSSGMIKIRGASSREFEKKQYGIKLLDRNGMESELPLLGMEADEDWVLSNSILDATGIRNYTAYNIGGQIFPFTPEAKFCEVILRNGENSEYAGLYLLTESAKQGKGRVDIADFDPKEERLSYLICRDRQDETGLTLSTWASDSQLCYGWFTVKYPKEELLSEYDIQRIESQLSQAEKVLYSEDYEEFETYPQYIDVNSFVDYFVVNEFFMNYDAGNNSTYYYQDYAHKLSMGPLWDYDNCWDNYSKEAGDAEYMTFVEKPWFEKLIQDSKFVKLVCKRYEELRKTILSTEYIEGFIDDTTDYLGNAMLRERSRWRAEYEARHLLHVTDEGRGYIIDRNRDTYEEEIVRMKDMMSLHGEWLDEYMDNFLSGYVVEGAEDNRIRFASAMAIVFVISFLVVINLVNRKMKGL